MAFIQLFRRPNPKIKIVEAKKDRFSGWLKCSGCNEMVHADELVLNCCPKCDYHYRLTLSQRIQLLTEEFEELFTEITAEDPLQFSDYKERLRQAQEKTGRSDAIAVGRAKINGRDTAMGVLDFSFMGGSMGSVVGEKN